MVGEHGGNDLIDHWAARWRTRHTRHHAGNLPAPSRFLQTRAEDVASSQRERLAQSHRRSNAVKPAAHLSAVRGEPPNDGRRCIGLVWQGQFAGRTTRWQSAQSTAPDAAGWSKRRSHLGIAATRRTTTRHRKGDRLDGGHGGGTQMAALIDAPTSSSSASTPAPPISPPRWARTWVLLRQPATGAMASAGETRAWSPTMRLFRQDHARRWEPVLSQASSEALRA